MKKYLFVFMLPLFLFSCSPQDFQRAMDTIGTAALTDADIARGLKEALNLGTNESVSFLSAKDGYHNSAYKILLPEEANTVINTLKKLPGFSKVEETLIKKINDGASDAATKAKPIFFNAIKSLTFSDVMSILMGERNAATTYLHGQTYNPLYGEFKPVIVTSLNKYGALDYWADAVNKYNSIPFITKVNPDLADHVTGKALVGLFDLVEKKENGIRADVSQRSSDLLKRVFESRISSI